MDQITRNKVLIGSLYKNINYARVHGSLNLKMLYFLEIVHSYILACENPTEFKDIQKLNQLSLIIQNKYNEICNYRFNDLIKFATIVGCENCKPGLNNNPFGLPSTNPTITNPPVIDPQPECPTFCQKTMIKEYNQDLDFVNLFESDEDFDFLTLTCYNSPDNSPAKFLRFNSLPTKGTLIYIQGLTETIITTNTIIDLTTFGTLTYYYTDLVSTEEGVKLLDSFSFYIGDSQVPTLYTNPVTFNLIPF